MLLLLIVHLEYGGGILNANHPTIMRPSIYPINHKDNLYGAFPEEWHSVEAYRDKVSYLISLFRIGRILGRLTNIVFYHNFRGRPKE